MAEALCLFRAQTTAFNPMPILRETNGMKAYRPSLLITIYPGELCFARFVKIRFVLDF